MVFNWNVLSDLVSCSLSQKETKHTSHLPSLSELFTVLLHIPRTSKSRFPPRADSVSDSALLQCSRQDDVLFREYVTYAQHLRSQKNAGMATFFFVITSSYLEHSCKINSVATSS